MQPVGDPSFELQNAGLNDIIDRQQCAFGSGEAVLCVQQTATESE